MPIYRAIKAYKASIPSSVEAAQTFLTTLPPLVQAQLISAIYLGREHIHCSQLRSDLPISRSYMMHIGQDGYAELLFRKGVDAANYLDKLVACARASNFDLNQL